RGIDEKDSVKCYLPDQDITAPWWASRAEVWWKLCADQPWWMGGFVWTGFDYRGEPTPFQWPNINSHFGIMDVCGFPKNIYYYYQSWWSDQDVIHISPHWNHKGMEDSLIKAWVNSNAEKVELFLNKKSLGMKEMPLNGHLEWMVPYAPGELVASGVKNGKKIITKVETTGEPIRVVLMVSKTNLKANDEDVAIVNVSVLDSAGREVPDALNLIKFSLFGNAKIIGVGNGDPSSHEADQCGVGKWQRQLFNGKCQVIFQAGTKPGKVILTATSDRLKDGTAEFVSF
ncbi:MAG: DUF4982 domain-containing protein, partial [Bacteroidota bacterium]